MSECVISSSPWTFYRQKSPLNFRRASLLRFYSRTNFNSTYKLAVLRKTNLVLLFRVQICPGLFGVVKMFFYWQRIPDVILARTARLLLYVGKLIHRDCTIGRMKFPFVTHSRGRAYRPWEQHQVV